MLVKLIIGLGNPGRKFAKTRHNVGHLFISKFKSQTSKLKIKNQVRLYKTTIFMNESGREIKKLSHDLRLTNHDLLIVHDDMDLPLGSFKLQFGRSAAGHRGVQSIIDSLGTSDFWRLRLGIGKSPVGITPEDFVLSEFSPEDLDKFQEVFKEAYPRVSAWVGGTSA